MNKFRLKQVGTSALGIFDFTRVYFGTLPEKYVSDFFCIENVQVLVIVSMFHRFENNRVLFAFYTQILYFFFSNL